MKMLLFKELFFIQKGATQTGRWQIWRSKRITPLVDGTARKGKKNVLKIPHTTGIYVSWRKRYNKKAFIFIGGQFFETDHLAQQQ